MDSTGGSEQRQNRGRSTRRSVLGATVGATGIAGCGADEHSATEQPRDPTTTAPGTTAVRSQTQTTQQADPPVKDLRSGYLVGQGPHTRIVVDPTTYETDADAIQQAHDDLVAELDATRGTGIVWIPSLKPDETEWRLTKTVTFDGDGSTNEIEVHPRGWGFFGRKSPQIQLDIDDGSPAFECRSMKGQGAVIGGFRAAGLEGGEDCEFLRLHRMTAWHYEHMSIRGIGGPEANGAITLDGACYNSYTNNCRYNAGQENDVTEGSFFAFRDLEDTGSQPGELKFGDGNSTYAAPDYPFKHAFDIGNLGVSDILIRGRYEGYGDHAIYATKGSLVLGDGLELGRPEDNDGSGTDRVHFTGWEITISDGIVMGAKNRTGGDNVYLEASQGSVGAFTSHVPSDGGHVINIPADTGSDNLVVPREQAFEGSVSYPDRFDQLVYHDGWQRLATGSVDVPAGGTAELGSWQIGEEHSIRVATRPANPDQDVYYSVQRGFNGDTEQTARVVDEESSGDYTLHYAVEKREH